MNADVRITVLRRTVNRDFLETHADEIWEPCERLADNQQFISKGANMPDGFCSFAWADILTYVFTLARGGNMRGVTPGKFVTCCTDGFRPVFMLLERLP